jgi:hypothetical protein
LIYHRTEAVLYQIDQNKIMLLEDQTTRVKTAHIHPATWNLAHWLTRHGSSTIYLCFALPQLLYRRRNQSGIFWIYPRIDTFVLGHFEPWKWGLTLLRNVGFQSHSAIVSSHKNRNLIFCVILYSWQTRSNPLTPELNPCLTRFFTGNFASWTVHFGNIYVKKQQIHQLLILFINYVWQLPHVSALHCHPQGAFLVPSERCSMEEQSIEYCGWACCG